MLSADHVRQVMVGKTGVTLTTGDVNSLNIGEVGVFTPAGTRLLTAAAAAQKQIRLGCKLPDGSIQMSSLIDKSGVGQLNAVAGANDQEFITYYGFNGTSGDIEEINSNTYIITGYIEQYFESESDGRNNKHIRAVSGLVADKHTIVQELAKDGARNFGVKSREPEPRLKAEIVSADDGAALTGTATEFTMTKGSNQIKIDGTLTNGGVDSFIRLGGTATTDPCYKVTAYTANVSVTVETAWQSASVVIPVAEIEVITKIEFAAAAVGLKLSGLPLSFDSARIGRSRFRKSIISFAAVNFGETLVTNAQSANKGTNASEEVAEQEYAQQKHEFGDNHYEVGEPNLFRSRFTVDLTEASYDAISIKFYHKTTGAFREDISNKELQVFYPSSAVPNYVSATNGLNDVLETFAGLTAGDLDV
jgi:hypothetical protein